jgi:hypothetical protein
LVDGVAARAAHVGGNPSRTDSVDQDPLGAQFVGELAGQGVEGGLGDSLGRGAAGHEFQGSGFAGDVHHPGVG